MIHPKTLRNTKTLCLNFVGIVVNTSYQFKHVIKEHQLCNSELVQAGWVPGFPEKVQH